MWKTTHLRTVATYRRILPLRATNANQFLADLIRWECGGFVVYDRKLSSEPRFLLLSQPHYQQRFLQLQKASDPTCPFKAQYPERCIFVGGPPSELA